MNGSTSKQRGSQIFEIAYGKRLTFWLAPCQEVLAMKTCNRPSRLLSREEGKLITLPLFAEHDQPRITLNQVARLYRGKITLLAFLDREE